MQGAGGIRSVIAPRNSWRRIGTSLLLLVFVVLASSCFRIKVELTIHEDETVSGVLNFGIAKDALDSLESFGEGFGEETESDPVESFEDECDTDFENATAERYEDDDFVGVICRFDGAPIETFTESIDEEGELTLVRDGDVYRLDGTFAAAGDLGGGEGAGFDPSFFLRDAELSFAFTFPGKVRETTGELSNGDRRVTFALTDFSEPLEIHAVAGAEAEGAGNTVRLIAGVVALLAIAAVVLLLLRSRTGGSTAPEPPVEQA